MRITIGLNPVRDKRNPPKEERVIEIAKQALGKKFIGDQLFKKIDAFNTARNDAAHNLALGNITYSQLEPIAKQSDDLINELQSLYAHIEIGPEQRIV